MNVMHSEWRGRINHWLRTLKDDFYEPIGEFKWEAARLMDFVLKVGNFGHNREVEWSNGFKRRTSLIWHRITDTMRLSLVFPIDAPKFLLNYAVDGVRGLVRR